MPQTIQNGIQTPINADAYNLAADLATMGGSANVVIPVANATALAALTPVVGNMAVQLDNNTLVVYQSTGWTPVITTAPFGHMGKTDGFQSLATAATVHMSAAQELVGGMTFDAGTSSLVIPLAGRYRITVCMYTSGGVGYCTGAIMKNGVSTGIVARVQQTNSSNDMTAAMTGSLPLAVGDKLSITGGFPFSTYGGNGYNGTYLEACYEGLA